MLTEGTRAPDFTLPGLPSDGSDSITQYHLSSELDERLVLLNFYLFDFHPECTKHLCDLHDLSWFTFEDDLCVYGVSTDRTFSHRAFADQEQLEFPLLSDSDGSVAESYGVLYDEFQGHKRIAKRSVFLVDRSQTIRYAWSAEDPADHPDWRTVRERVERIKEA